MNGGQPVCESPGEPDTAGRRLRGLTTLIDVTRRLAAELDLPRVLEVVTNEACLALNCERATLYLYDSDRKELYSRVATRLEIKEIRTPLERGINGWVARERRLINVPEASADRRWNPWFDRLTGYRTRNILAGPLISLHEDRLVGVLEALNKRGGAFDRFDEELLEAFGSHAAVALERAKLLEDSEAKRRLEISLDLARTIQRGFMPERLPQITGYELASWWETAEFVAGDYFDVMELPDGRMGVVVADVCGHGVGASLIMATVRAALHGLAQSQSRPDLLLGLLSRTLAGDVYAERFITLFCGALDYRRHVLEYANAGHGPVMHFSGRTGRFSDLVSTGFPLGIEPEATWSCGPVVRIEPGDLLVLCTDGMTEARNKRLKMLGQARLEQLVGHYRDLPCAELAERLGQAVKDHRGPVKPADDATFLVVRRTAAQISVAV